ncbi:hypothetical protein V8C42DRAFT_325295 [Trichoderma barbatum]
MNIDDFPHSSYDPPDTDPHVVYLEQWCRACGEAFSSGDPFVAVFSDGGAVRVFGSNEYPGGEDDPSLSRGRIGRSFFNWDPFMPYDRDESPDHDSATIHTGCFNLFQQNCTDGNEVRRLLLAAVWRSPWENAPKFKLTTNPDIAGLVQLAAKACNLPQLESMPTELKRLVCRELLTQPSIITRYQSVISLAADSSRQDFDEQASLPIGKVASWERGERPTSEEGDHLPVIRITIDCQGVKRIERLAQKPELLSQRSDTELYIVESQEALVDLKVQFQSGLARLKKLGDRGAIHLIPWDTSTPPAVEHLLSPTARSPRNKVTQFSTIDVSKITGITFFMTWQTQTMMTTNSGPVFFIHAHTPKTPSAKPTFDRLSAQDWAGVWYYVPFPSNDRLTFFGVRHVHAIYLQVLFRFEKAGDCIVGFQSRRNPTSHDMVWPVDDQLLLVCGITESGNTVTLDAHPKRSGTIKPPFALPSNQHLPALDCPVFMSSAPLEHVVCLRLYTDEDVGICRGILLEYENGAQRTLGECRIGLDLERAYLRPVCIYIGQKWGLRRWTIKVRVDGQPEHKLEKREWKRHDMRGTLTCRYMYGCSGLKVVADESI